MIAYVPDGSDSERVRDLESDVGHYSARTRRAERKSEVLEQRIATAIKMLRDGEPPLRVASYLEGRNERREGR